ncbi:MAG TPA: hypothetical protein DCM28_18030 [Phycisphaerales bacterium]|nr:hypothetical protein [Phycisphaerales bacterium]HCD33234.1 hypothetical protein [Phycisphaerales bacterium]|tara:strand:+ start:134 stop:490 length:357 start_codon:yes stop_codon:yes gene_type:complete
MRDYLNFRKMITPFVLQVLFWVFVVIVELTGFSQIIAGLFTQNGSIEMVLIGILTVLAGPLFIRIYCELLIVIFSINNTLLDIRSELRKKQLPANQTELHGDLAASEYNSMHQPPSSL